MSNDQTRRRLRFLLGNADIICMEQVRQRELNRAVELLNRWLLFTPRPHAARLLAEILKTRQAAHVKQDSLTGLF